MTREFVESIESKLNINFGYFIRCDDERVRVNPNISTPKGIATDMYFHLWETERLIYALELFEKHNLNYDFGFQEWDEESQEIDEILYVDNNYLNNC